MGRAAFDAASLVAQSPLKLTHPNKAFLYELVGQSRAPVAGEIVVSRWSAMPVRSKPREGPAPRFETCDDPFDYEPAPVAERPVVWHLNFADDHLFAFYGGPAFGQDEIQVAEHPALASLLGRLRDGPLQGLAPLTRERGAATPVLITGVERRASIDTASDLLAGRLYGLYGRRFQRATQAEIRSAVTRLDPPTTTNLIAIAALQGGAGVYTEAQLCETLATAYTGFRAACLESRRLAGPGAKTVVHTGHWGGGAFGNDRVLMATLQLLAARLAGLDALTYHTFDTQGAADYAAATRLLERLLISAATTAEIIAALLARKFTWGTPDGN